MRAYSAVFSAKSRSRPGVEQIATPCEKRAVIYEKCACIKIIAHFFTLGISALACGVSSRLGPAWCLFPSGDESGGLLNYSQRSRLEIGVWRFRVHSCTLPRTTSYRPRATQEETTQRRLQTQRRRLRPTAESTELHKRARDEMREIAETDASDSGSLRLAQSGSKDSIERFFHLPSRLIDALQRLSRPARTCRRYL